MDTITYFYDLSRTAPQCVFARRGSKVASRRYRVFLGKLPNGSSVLKQLKSFLAVFGIDSFFFSTDEGYWYDYPGESACAFIFKNRDLVLRVLRRIELLHITDVPKLTSFMARRKWLFADFMEDDFKLLFIENCAIMRIEGSDDIFIGHRLFTFDGTCHRCCSARAVSLKDPCLVEEVNRSSNAIGSQKRLLDNKKSNLKIPRQDLVVEL